MASHFRVLMPTIWKDETRIAYSMQCFTEQMYSYKEMYFLQCKKRKRHKDAFASGCVFISSCAVCVPQELRFSALWVGVDVWALPWLTEDRAMGSAVRSRRRSSRSMTLSWRLAWWTGSCCSVETTWRDRNLADWTSINGSWVEQYVWNIWVQNDGCTEKENEMIECYSPDLRLFSLL